MMRGIGGKKKIMPNKVTIVDSKGTRTAEVDLAKSFDKFKEVNQLLRDWDQPREKDGENIEDYEISEGDMFREDLDR